MLGDLMQQLDEVYTVLAEFAVVKLNRSFSEEQFLALAQGFVEQQAWPIAFMEQGADWQVLGFYLEQQLWWWRYDALSQSAWFECANSEAFSSACASLLSSLKRAKF
jgi:hypothetical protein